LLTPLLRLCCLIFWYWENLLTLSFFRTTLAQSN
jgi:hypothetical protein